MRHIVLSVLAFLLCSSNASMYTTDSIHFESLVYASEASPVAPAAFIEPLPEPPRLYVRNPLHRLNYLLDVCGFNCEVPQVPSGYKYWGSIIAKVTAYEPSYVSCGTSADGRTATMRSAWKMDGCAVDPSAIPYGTLIWVPGIGWRVADDTGSAMRKSWKKGEYHIDVRMRTVWQAKRWGSQSMVPVMLCLPEQE